MTTTPVSICQAALTRIGAAPLSSFTEGTAEAVIAEANYEGAKASILALYPWRVSMETRELNLLTDTPHPPWLKAWNRPSDAIKIWNVRRLSDGGKVTFDVQGQKILTLDEDAVIADYGFNCDEAFLEPHIVELMVLKMASVFANGIADRASMAEVLDNAFKMQFTLAKTADAQGRTPNQIRASRWTRTR